MYDELKEEEIVNLVGGKHVLIFLQLCKKHVLSPRTNAKPCSRYLLFHV